MRMTIDEARTALGKERKYALHENKQAYDIAIETMRKYQKIEHIVNDVPYLDKDEYKIASIKEIINGNDD